MFYAAGTSAQAAWRRAGPCSARGRCTLGSPAAHGAGAGVGKPSVIAEAANRARRWEQTRGRARRSSWDTSMLGWAEARLRLATEHRQTLGPPCYVLYAGHHGVSPLASGSPAWDLLSWRLRSEGNEGCFLSSTCWEMNLSPPLLAWNKTLSQCAEQPPTPSKPAPLCLSTCPAARGWDPRM